MHVLAIAGAFLSFLALARGTASPSPTSSGSSSSGSFSNAKFTYYSAGLGACGTTNTDSDPIVALNSAQWDGGKYCNQKISISYNGKTQSATIMDKCPGCPEGGLDLTPTLFSELAPTSVGVIYGEWSFA